MTSGGGRAAAGRAGAGSLMKAKSSGERRGSGCGVEASTRPSRGSAESAAWVEQVRRREARRATAAARRVIMGQLGRGEGGNG